MKVFVVTNYKENRIFGIFDSLEKAKNYSLEEAKKDPCFIPELDDVEFVFEEINYDFARYCVWEKSKALDCEIICFYIKEFVVK